MKAVLLVLGLAFAMMPAKPAKNIPFPICRPAYGDSGIKINPAAARPLISISRLDLYTRVCEARRIRYRRGTKPGACELGHFPPADSHLDCSGFVQGAIAYATEGRLILPQGSVEQLEWFARHGYKRCNILDAGINDGKLHICFHRPGHLERSGHVWLVYRRQTMECWGEHGVGSRFWNARTQSGYRLSDLCDACFVLN